MIIKIATGKDENGNIKWTHLYSAAIRNRLRRDLNLADIPDPAEARKNLGIEAYVAEVTDDLYNKLKQYIDKQDIHYDTTLRTYITNNIETELEAHANRLDEIEDSMVTKDAFDSYFKVSWDKRVPALKKELQDYSDANLVTAKKYTDDKIRALNESLREYINTQIDTLSRKIYDVDTRVKNMIINLNKNFNAISTDLDGIYNAAGTELSRLEKEIQKTNQAMGIMANIDERIAQILGNNSIATSSDDTFFKGQTKSARDLLNSGGATGSSPKQRTYRYQVTLIS